MSYCGFFFCGVKFWARFIGYFQLISGIVAAGLGIYGLVSVVGVEARNTKYIAKFSVIVAISTLNIIMAIPLLAGSHQKKSKLIQVWMVYGLGCTIISVTVLVLGIIAMLFYGLDLLPTVLGLFFNIILSIGCLNVVKRHMESIDEGSRVNPRVEFQRF